MRLSIAVAAALLISLPVAVSAQTLEQQLEKYNEAADRALKQGDHDTAIVNLRRARRAVEDGCSAIQYAAAEMAAEEAKGRGWGYDQVQQRMEELSAAIPCEL